MTKIGDKQIQPIAPSDQRPLVLYSQGTFVPYRTLTDVAIFPGSFNPLHVGHRQLCQVASRRLGCRVVFELSLTNADKARISTDELTARLSQFADEPVALTEAPLFQQKASLFPRCWFVVGYDTAARMLNPRYYHDGHDGVLRCLHRLHDGGNRFLVGGRAVNGRFCGRSELHVPEGFASMFEFLSESEFRQDVSSTELRQRHKGQSA